MLTNRYASTKETCLVAQISHAGGNLHADYRRVRGVPGLGLVFCRIRLEYTIGPQ